VFYFCLNERIYVCKATIVRNELIYVLFEWKFENAESNQSLLKAVNLSWKKACELRMNEILKVTVFFA
jgi:hypothetical protein